MNKSLIKYLTYNLSVIGNPTETTSDFELGQLAAFSRSLKLSYDYDYILVREHIKAFMESVIYSMRETKDCREIDYASGKLSAYRRIIKNNWY